MADKKISALTAATTPLAGTEVLPIVQSGSTVKVANNDLRPKQIQSNATSGVLQVTGPAAAATRVMTVPDANFTAARTDAAQTFAALQTVSVAGNTGTNSANVFDLLVSGGAAKYGTFRFSDNATYSAWLNWNNAYLTLTGPGAGSGFALDGSGNAKIENGNLVQGTAAKGFNFTANTPAAGMTSQLLNWYEEGTWTPVIGGATSQTGQTYSVQAGYYTRVGNVVHAQFRAVLSAKGTITGAIYIKGLPFTIKNANGGQAAMVINLFSGMATNWIVVQGIGELNTTTVYLTGISAAGAANNTQLQPTDISDTTQFVGSVTYLV